MSQTANPVRNARSLLFVPGNRPERFAKAEDSGADLVCIDLEDAVPPAERADARARVLSHLRGPGVGPRTGVRISRLGVADGLRDLLWLADAVAAGTRPAFVMLAKTDDAPALALLGAHLPGVPLIALVESPLGLSAAAGLARAHPQVQALMLGGADLCAELGASFGWDALVHARGTLVAAAAGAGIACIDVPWLAVDDPAGLAAETRRVAALGFTTKSCIHPQQIGPVHDALAPTPADLQRAQLIVDAAGPAGLDAPAVMLNGRVVDRPVVLSALRLLARAQGR